MIRVPASQIALYYLVQLVFNITCCAMLAWYNHWLEFGLFIGPAFYTWTISVLTHPAIPEVWQEISAGFQQTKKDQ